MNLLLLDTEDLVTERRAVVRGRRRDHVAAVLRAAAGSSVIAGMMNGPVGRAEVLRIDEFEVELGLDLCDDPPPPAPVRLAVAVPRPKVLNRVIASATSFGVKDIALINSWRVEKSYWTSPRLEAVNLREQAVAGLEQARDTVLPRITLHRFFRRFVEEEVDTFAAGTRRLVAHPGAAAECPRGAATPLTFAIGPEGGFIQAEIDSLVRAGFEPVTIGRRPLRVETAVAAVLGRVL